MSSFTKQHKTDPAWIGFRKQVLASVDKFGEAQYITEYRSVGVCPICDEPLGVRFKGRHLAVDFVCHGGCAKADVAQAIVGGVA